MFSKLRTEEIVTKCSSLTDAFLSHINSAEVVVSFCDNIVQQLQSCLQVNRREKVSFDQSVEKFSLVAVVCNYTKPSFKFVNAVELIT